jgi:lysozyme
MTTTDNKTFRLVVEELKRDEGFRAMQYNCPLGFPTIGYGTKLPFTAEESKFISDPRHITEAEAEFLLSTRLLRSIHDLENKNGISKIMSTLSEKRKSIIYNMVYQLGVDGVVKFKKMWQALESKDYTKAASEMLDSKWHKQTPARAARLSIEMRKG